MATKQVDQLSEAHLAKKVVKELDFKGHKITIKEDDNGAYAYVNGKHIGLGGFGFVREAIEAAKDYIGDGIGKYRFGFGD